MSDYRNASLRDGMDDDEGEEQLASTPDRSSGFVQRSESKNVGENFYSENMEPNTKVISEGEDDGTSHNSIRTQLSDADWVAHEEGDDATTPITAYLNAFFMTIATVLVRYIGRKGS